MRKAFLIAPVMILLIAGSALATRWYEVDDDKPARPQAQEKPRVEEKTEEAPAAAADKAVKTVATWLYTYGGRGEDSCRSISRTEDGYMLGGYTRSFGAGGGDAWFINVGADGKALWDKAYGVTLEEDALGVASLDTGGFCAAGKTAGNKFLALKLDGAGNVEWDKTLGGAQPAVGTGVDSIPGGGCMVTGYFSRNPGKPCDGYAWMAKLGNDGETLWEWNDAPACTSWMRAVKGLQSGSTVAAGEKFDGKQSTQYWIVKLDGDRRIEWEIIDATKNYRVYSVKSLLATDDGGFVVTGGAKVSTERTDIDGWVIKIDSAGVVQWEKHFNAPGDPDIINDIIQIEGRGYAAAGYKLMENGRFKGSMLELDPYGTILWHKTYGGAGSENFTGIVPAVEGDGYVVSGVTTSKGAGNYDFVILKTDKRGVCRGCNF